MIWCKRVFVFLILLSSIVTSIFYFFKGAFSFLDLPFSLYSQQLIIVSIVWGFLGGICGLCFSKKLAMKTYGIELTSLHQPGKGGEAYQLLKQLVEEQNLPYIPQLGIYSSNSTNAFATGISPKHSLIALSSSLIHKLNRLELKSVIAHELGHIINGDMITMTILQGTIQSFIFFLSRIIASILTRREQKRSYFLYFMTTFVCEIGLTFLGTLLLSAFSRRREYKADHFAAKTTSANSMIGALKSLNQHYEEDQRMAALMIKNPHKYRSWFSTHPSIEKRINVLKKNFESFSQEVRHQQ